MALGWSSSAFAVTSTHVITSLLRLQPLPSLPYTLHTQPTLATNLLILFVFDYISKTALLPRDTPTRRPRPPHFTTIGKLGKRKHVGEDTRPSKKEKDMAVSPLIDHQRALCSCASAFVTHVLGVSSISHALHTSPSHTRVHI
jgi:hypothetical protein